MSSGGQTPVTQQTTQTRDPWAAAQPHLIETMENARGLFQSNVGYQPYEGNTTANPFNDFTNQGINNINALVAGEPFGSGNLANARNILNAMTTGYGMTPYTTQPYALDAAVFGQAPGMFQNFYNTAAGNLGNVYNTGATQLGDIYNRAQGQQNPYLQAEIDTSNRRIADKVNAAMAGAGRYGSGSHTDVMTRAMAEAANPVLAQDYAARQQLGLQAAGQLGQLGQGIFSNLGQLGMGAAQGIGQQQLGAAQQMGALGQAGETAAGKAAELAPALDQARFANAGYSMGIGDLYKNYQQALLDQQLKLYNAQQARPWEQLSRYTGILGGAGGLGGTQITTSPGATQPSTLQRVLGGGLAGAGLGASIGGLPGAGIGAVGGGLLGLL